MKNSLQDQLKKSGLVNDKQLKKARHEKQSKRRKGDASADAQNEEARRLAKAAAAEKVERDRALNRERQAEANAKAVRAQVRQLIETNRVSREGGEVPFNFTHGSTVRRILVTPEQHRQIVSGGLAVVLLGETYELVPVAVLSGLIERAPDVVIVDNSTPEAKAVGEVDDQYAGYEVPDDLTW